MGVEIGMDLLAQLLEEIGLMGRPDEARRPLCRHRSLDVPKQGRSIRRKVRPCRPTRQTCGDVLRHLPDKPVGLRLRQTGLLHHSGQFLAQVDLPRIDRLHHRLPPGEHLPVLGLHQFLGNRPRSGIEQ